MGQLVVNDQKNMNEIVEISKLIGNVYQKLFFLHVDLKENAKEYSTLLSVLEELRQKEKVLYEKIGLTPEKASSLIDYLVVSERIEMPSGNNVLNAIYMNDYDKLYPIRIINNLIDLSFKNKHQYLDWLVEEGSFSNTKQAENYFKIKLFENSIDSDFERNFMCQLNAALTSNISELELDRFCRIKYQLSYLSSSLEDALIEQNDNIDYYVFPFVGEINNIAIEYCESIQIEKSSMYTSHAMKGIFIKDDLIDDSVKVDFEIFKMYMRTGFGFVYNIDNYDELLDILADEILETNDEANGWLQMSADVLLNELDSIENERSKCKYLHFIPRK